MAERQRVARRVRSDERFPPLETWWPVGVSLDRLRERTRGEAPVYFTAEREAEIDAWWQAAQERNKQRTEEKT